MSTERLQARTSREEILSRVVDCIARATRYPAEILTPGADLENDLGIDSVKQVEVIAELGKEFEVDLLASRDPSIRTIEQVAVWIASAVRPSAPNAAAEVSPPAAPTASMAASAPASFGVPSVASVSASVVPLLAPSLPSSPANPGGKPLAGRVALVTGSGRGIGRTVAQVLAQQGATVIVNSFHSRDQGERTAAEIQANGGTAVHLWGSVAKPDHVETLFAEIDRRFGGLDILVCNASDGRIGSFADLTPEDWDRAFRTNVSGHYHCAMLAAPRMQARGGGAIVTTSAVGAHQYVHGLGSQGVVKAAVESMTRYLACELARFGVRANCVAAGPVYGELLAKFPDARAVQQHWETMTPDATLVSPIDLAHTIAFLVSDQARAINGAVWTIDRGFSAHADRRFQAHGQPVELRVARGS